MKDKTNLIDGLESGPIVPERLARHWFNVATGLRAENDRLKAYAEAMYAAGYAMAIKINVHGINDRFTDSEKLVSDWSKAARDHKPL